MNVKPGDKVRIVSRSSYHAIPIGADVEIIEVQGESVIADYRGYRYIVTGDFEVVSENTTLELIARLSTELVRLKAEVAALKNRPVGIVVNVNAGGSEQ